ncbi:hypothetical protein KR018_004728, partial [Drosophila ironensis]
DCPLSKPLIEGTNRVFTNVDVAGNYELKRVEQVRTGEVLSMFCQPNDVVKTTCQANSTFSIPLPQRCNNPIGTTTEIVADPSCSATMYSVGYTINNRRLELYRACFDRGSVKALFTSHQTYHKTIREYTDLVSSSQKIQLVVFTATERSCPAITTDGVVSDADGINYNPANVYNTFRRILGRNQRYIRNDRDTIIVRGQLTPWTDFLFGDQICATFKYVNVVPLFKSIADANWQNIERWVRSSIGAGSHLRIKTGASGILSLASSDRRRRQRRIFLSSNDKNPVPEWIYKVVRTAANQPQTVFLTYNNIFATRRPAVPRFCRSVPCPLTLANTAAAGYTFCCNAAAFTL